MSILVAGSIALDTVETPFGRAEDVLGGSAVHFATAASRFTEVRVLAPVGDDFDDGHIERMNSMGIDTRGVQSLPGETLRWHGRYDYSMHEPETLALKLNVLEKFDPSVPDFYRDSRYVFLANMDPEVQLGVLSQVSDPKLVASDTMSLWIQEKPASIRELLSRVNVLIINDSEARELAWEPQILRAARVILDMGPEYLIVKRGVHGALMFSRQGIFWTPSYPLESVVDPTGSGDAFAGGFMGHIVEGHFTGIEKYERSTVYGAVVASFAIEDYSINGLTSLTEAEIGRRFSTFTNLCKQLR